MTQAPMQTNWDKMTDHQRLTAVGIDIMNHKEFALLAGFVVMGKIELVDGMPTAGTNGRDEFYGAEWMRTMDRQQLRYVRIHENFHKALRHCSDYRDLSSKFPQHTNMAMDYVINGFIEEMDPKHTFVKRPTQPVPLLDAKYNGMSFIEVLRDLLKKYPPQQQQQAGKGKGKGGKAMPGEGDPNGGTLDEHMDLPDDVDLAEHTREVEAAARQGKIVVEKMAGKGSANSALDAVVQERKTDWREALREFITSIVMGDDNSRYCPPNKRLLPLGILMPSHYSEAVGEVIVACDTSGSMGSVYPVVFGEIARIVQTCTPESVRILWWDTAVCGDQQFAPHEYEQIAGLLKPAGGGGTSPGAVVAYMKAKKYKPAALVWLTDGYLDGTEADPGCPQLWGVVDNLSYTPPLGKVVHIDSMRL